MGITSSSHPIFILLLYLSRGWKLFLRRHYPVEECCSNYCHRTYHNRIAWELSKDCDARNSRYKLAIKHLLLLI